MKKLVALILALTADPEVWRETVAGRWQGRNDAGISGDPGEHEAGEAAKPRGWGGGGWRS